MKVLIIEDEKDLLLTLAHYFKAEGYVCESASTFSQAHEKIWLNEYDIILLDIGLPDGNGIDLLKLIKSEKKNSAVLIISAKNSLDDKIKGLNIGADDYITKPFHLAELNARINAVLRRNQFDGNNVLIFNEISINSFDKTVKINNKEISLTKKEFDLLLFFVVNKNRVLTKENLVEHLWPDNADLFDSYDFIYTHLNNVRRKIKAAGGNDYIKTIYGMGYKFCNEE
ncbi:MAG TPA: response regulator transcription factor [Bacteroidales bacterium]|jgi:DNA-binding response OmpR family regulator|nr:response regulator transcription factor [Bacteroidales bacterium]HOU98409.1 response regulator transcription factor [Bacteroidales bacterium]